MKVHVFVTMVSKSALKSPNLLPSFTKTAISLNDGITRRDKGPEIRPNAMSFLNLVVCWWYAEIEKPHPRCLECGFIVTPTESLFYGNL